MLGTGVLQHLGAIDGNDVCFVIDPEVTGQSNNNNNQNNRRAGHCTDVFAEAVHNFLKTADFLVFRCQAYCIITHYFLPPLTY